LIPDIEKFLPVAIFKMATTIPHKFTHIWNVIEIGQCWICAVLWWPFWKWRPVEIFQCQESFQDIIIYPHMKCRWNRTMLNLCGIVVAIGHHSTAQIQHCSISTSWIDSWHWKISTGLHFQNGRHNTAKIQHCSISKVAFHLFFKPVICGRFGRLHNR
jgi:hypothetical protein